MRIISLDVGAKSCGIAITDELKITAQGVENFKFKEQDWKTLISHLKTYFLKYEIDTIVVGRPTLPSGDSSKTTLMIEGFVEELKNYTDIKTIFWDENGSTKAANKVMIEAGMTREKRKEKKDMLAAVIILQDFLQYA